MQKDEIPRYESELEKSFDFVVREGDQLFEGQGRLKKTYESLAQRLDDLGIAYSLVGGFALILYGVRRFTEDIDLLISADGLSQMHEHLIGRDYVQITPGGRNLRDAETGVRIEFVVTDEFPGDGKPKPVAFPDPNDVLEIRQGIKVINLKSFIELKLASGMTATSRLQDLADVQRLIQLHQLKTDFTQQLHPFVREKFLELLS